LAAIAGPRLFPLPAEAGQVRDSGVHQGLNSASRGGPSADEEPGKNLRATEEAASPESEEDLRRGSVSIQSARFGAIVIASLGQSRILARNPRSADCH
jgi:hypothetical protein